MFKKKKTVNGFFLTDNQGNLYKASAIDDNSFVLDEDEEVKEKTEEKVEEKETKDEELTLTPEEIAFVKKLYADSKVDENLEDEKSCDEVEEVEKEVKEEVIDTNRAKDSAKSFGSLEPQTKIDDSKAYAYQDEVAKAWANRGKKKEN